MRTKKCRKLGDFICTSVCRIAIGIRGVKLDGYKIDRATMGYLAERDGFPSLIDFTCFFLAAARKSGKRTFKGHLIRWRKP
jgi:hypothetical protein